MTQSAMQFEQMITAMRKRLRPNGARLLADWLRICVGLSYEAQSGDNGDRRLGFMAGGQKITQLAYRGSARPEAKGQLSWIAGSDGPIGGIRSKSCRKTYPSGRSSEWTLSLPSSLRTLSHCAIQTPTHCARLVRSCDGFGRALNLKSGRSCHSNVNSRF